MAKEVVLVAPRGAAGRPKKNNALLVCMIIFGVILALIIIAIIISETSYSSDETEVSSSPGGAKVVIITLSADSWCGFCKKMAAQKDQVASLCKKNGFEYKFVSDISEKEEFEKLKAEHKPRGFPHTSVSIDGVPKFALPGFMPAEPFVEKIKSQVGEAKKIVSEKTKGKVKGKGKKKRGFLEKFRRKKK